MDKKLPYYMAYPMPLMYDDEKRERIDFEYIKGMYPDTAKRLLPYIEDECDRMEYEGSMMFDEYPDRLQMMLMGRRVFDKAQKDHLFTEGKGSARGEKDQNNSMLRELIQVMLYQEIYKRRSDHRKYRRKYYPGVSVR